MINEEIKNRLKEVVKDELCLDEPMANHTTIKAGGRAEVFVTVKDEDELSGILQLARSAELPVFALGAGSNVLIRDGGLEGIVVSMLELKKFDIKNREGEGVIINAQTGLPIGDLVNFSINEGLAGFEPLAGIPGTVGGALHMNAGTHDGTISGPLIEVIALDRAGRSYSWPKEKIEFSYRHAKFPKACIIVSADFRLINGSKEEIGQKVDELRRRRRERHPLKWPSMGSIFRNPDKGPSAGELIEDAGLKGVRVGGARVSEQHGNWIVNEGGASAKDIEVLIHLVREKVREATEISLETEVVVVGKK